MAFLRVLIVFINSSRNHQRGLTERQGGAEVPAITGLPALARPWLAMAHDAGHTSTVTKVNAKLVMRLSGALKSIRVIKSAHPLFSRQYRVPGNFGRSR